MNDRTITQRSAVCSWSLQPASPQVLIGQLQDIGLSRVQLALDPLRENPSIWGAAQSLFRQSGITIVSGMFGCIGEDYTTLETIRKSGGLAPDATWEKNLQNIKATAPLAKQLGLKLVTFHAGFLPHDESDPNFTKMLKRLAEVAGIFSGHSLALGLETGQETARDLLRLLEKLQCPNVGVNFDPANMILYDKGDPIEAVAVLGPWIRQVHIKDATRTKLPGTWGREVPAGTGEVAWAEFFSTLKRLKFTGDFVIEREAGNQRSADIRQAKQMVETLGGA